MKITIRLQQLSDPMIFEDIYNAYTKGPLYCLRLKDNSTLKFPLVSIFSIKEETKYTTNSNDNVQRQSLIIGSR